MACLHSRHAWTRCWQAPSCLSHALSLYCCRALALCQQDKEMVDGLLALKARLDEVLASALQKSEPFAQALREAFESAINQRSNKPAELIAKFIDATLRMGSGAKGRSDDEMEGLLDRALVLFRYIQVTRGEKWKGWAGVD